MNIKPIPNSKACGILQLMGLMSLTCVLVLTGCDRQKPPRDSDAASGPSRANVTKGVKPLADTDVAVIDTEDPAYGQIVIELYSNIAPKMVERFKQLIKDGFYDGTAFHRISLEGGIVQGGDPLSKDNDPSNDGTGDSKYPNVPAEFSDILYERSVVGAARQGEHPGLTEEQSWNTANCQFYITLKRQPAFDQQYTVFGRVIGGINNAEIMAHAPVEPGTERPIAKIVIKSITLQPRSNFAK